MKKLGLSFFPAYDWAISPTHPEREERLLYTQDQLFEEGIDDLDMIEFINPIFLDERAQRVHFICQILDRIALIAVVVLRSL